MSTEKTWGEILEAELQTDLEFLTEMLVLRVSGAIRRRMRETNTNQTDLASKLGVSQPYVSKLLNCNANLTLRSMARIAHALGAEWIEPNLVALDTKDNVDSGDAVECFINIGAVPKQMDSSDFEPLEPEISNKECAADGFRVAFAA